MRFSSCIAKDFYAGGTVTSTVLRQGALRVGRHVALLCLSASCREGENLPEFVFSYTLYVFDIVFYWELGNNCRVVRIWAALCACVTWLLYIVSYGIQQFLGWIRYGWSGTTLSLRHGQLESLSVPLLRALSASLCREGQREVSRALCLTASAVIAAAPRSTEGFVELHGGKWHIQTFPGQGNPQARWVERK